MMHKTDVLNRLRQLLAQSQPNVVIVVGAGVSIGATGLRQASWKGLLENGLRYLGSSNIITEGHQTKLQGALHRAFKPFDLSAALQIAEIVDINLKALSIIDYNAWLQSAFSEFASVPKRNLVLSALNELRHAGALLLTTNYDGLLSTTTGLVPITWKDPQSFLKVMRRKAQGILHVHGHWDDGESVVLGKTSHDRIVADQVFQEVLKSLWLEWTWIFVGCGNGLGDPNVGRLIEWGKKHGIPELPNYFLAPFSAIDEIDSKNELNPNLIRIPYKHHDEIPVLLESITPQSRCFPFERVDNSFSLLRRANQDIPVPSRDEYLAGFVPTLKADQQVVTMLEEYGWAFVFDKASVGKTTMALRIAHLPRFRNQVKFYLDLNRVSSHWSKELESTNVLGNICRPEGLIILDNVHRNPALTRQLWEAWRQTANECMLLIIATDTQSIFPIRADEDLTFFRENQINAPIALTLDLEDIVKIARYVFTSAQSGSHKLEMSMPPVETLSKWQSDFKGALAAFVVALRSRLSSFVVGDWDLPPASAANWVQKEWLNKLHKPEMDNLLCLCVFANQQFEMPVVKDGLPHPEAMDNLCQMGLVTFRKSGNFGQNENYSLKEPAWGQLILAAVKMQGRTDHILLSTARKSPDMFGLLAAKLRTSITLSDLRELLWNTISENSEGLLDQLSHAAIDTITLIAKEAKAAKRNKLTIQIWDLIESNPAALVSKIFNVSLQQFGELLELARNNNRDVTLTWNALEKQPELLIRRMRQASAFDCGILIKTAHRHERNIELYWNWFEHNPTDLLTFNELGYILKLAHEQGREAKAIWAKANDQSDQLFQQLWHTSLQHLSFFLKTSDKLGIDVEQLWKEIENRPTRFVESAFRTGLEGTRALLKAAKQQDRNIQVLWAALKENSLRFEQRIWRTSIEHISSFLSLAYEQEIELDAFWSILLKEPFRLVKKIIEGPLGHSVSLLKLAAQQGRDVTKVWNEIENVRNTLIDKIWHAPLDHSASFMRIAANQERLLAFILEKFSTESDRFVEKCKQARIHELADFQRRLPLDLLHLAFSAIQPGHWAGNANDRSISGAGILIKACRVVERVDLQRDLANLLLNRTNENDFLPNRGGLNELVLLINSTGPSDKQRVDQLIQKICSSKWLKTVYTNNQCSTIATALHRLANHQDTSRCRFFSHSSLVDRIHNELKWLIFRQPVDQIGVFQLLGSAYTIGVTAKAENSGAISATTLSPLVDRLLGLDLSFEKRGGLVRLLLGLRAYEEMSHSTIHIQSSFITRAVDFLGDVDERGSPQGRAHINTNISRWLKSCLQSTSIVYPHTGDYL